MNEWAQTKQILAGNLGCHLDKFPSGKYGFVGTVPVIAYYADGATEKQIEDARKFGERFGPKRRIFETEQEARDFAKLHNITIKN